MNYSNFPNPVFFQFSEQDTVDSFHLPIAGITNNFFFQIVIFIQFLKVASLYSYCKILAICPVLYNTSLSLSYTQQFVHPTSPSL